MFLTKVKVMAEKMLFGQSTNASSRNRAHLELVYLVTALVPSDTACLASSPGSSRRTAVWISREGPNATKKSCITKSKSITKPTMHYPAPDNSVKPISSLIYEETLPPRVPKHSKHKTNMAMDVFYAIKSPDWRLFSLGSQAWSIL
ncbi:hypothetical protein A6R68_11325 [Neotoma lepida]|uniref:Uncharacterized protein n=1 Tax=Neotoma lepida TaxID=56216 RepID=A0A1A6FUB1_NEOLE|nr:hypothetical protein A6R68_11325 [Neotoma lepida]